jgi:IS605 OrfB family transposase
VHVRNQRADFHHKTARVLANTSGVIAVEDLNVKGVAGGMLAKSVNDAGWSAFISTLAYQAEEAGRKLLTVNPRGTSQTCVCGAPVPKTLRHRWHQCEACGLSAARDHVSAQRILGLGLSLFGRTSWLSTQAFLTKPPRLRGGVVTLQEGLTILAWIALWRPGELLLYEWYPFTRDAAVFGKLERAVIQVIAETKEIRR